MNTSTHPLQQALTAHKLDGRHSRGTAAIVESLHTDFNLSYEQIADIAQVSVAGLGRWRKRDKGDREAFAPLLKYAEKLLGGASGAAESNVPGSSNADTARQTEPSTEVRQPVPLTIAEAKLGLSLKFGVDPSMIDIVIRG